MQVFQPPKSRTRSTGETSQPDKKGYPLRSIWPRTGAMTPTTRALWAMWAKRGCHRLSEDMKTLFDQIPLDQMSVSMTMNGAVLPDDGVFYRCCRGAGRPAGPAYPGRFRTIF
jgi:hypothetical protein